MKNKKIVRVKQWPKLQSIKDIQTFLKFTNFFQQFIQKFSQIIAPLILILKTLSIKSTELRKNVIKVDDDGKKNYSNKTKLYSQNDVNDGKVNSNEVIRGKIIKKSLNPKNYLNPKKQ